ncbi:hypothetical protein AGLY_014105 [Aphis glycines]|uniref:Uncharacterized protein n=1 Tax=Aphis glycines TaxID=307491 RepID=A0A6G0T699_APHGL|nr:hypothetical protein AGLY_014105 [Aphis glycines]
MDHRRSENSPLQQATELLEHSQQLLRAASAETLPATTAARVRRMPLEQLRRDPVPLNTANMEEEDCTGYVCFKENILNIVERLTGEYYKHPHMPSMSYGTLGMDLNPGINGFIKSDTDYPPIKLKMQESWNSTIINPSSELWKLIVMDEITPEKIHNHINSIIQFPFGTAVDIDFFEYNELRYESQDVIMIDVGDHLVKFYMDPIISPKYSFVETVVIGLLLRNQFLNTKQLYANLIAFSTYYSLNYNTELNLKTLKNTIITLRKKK